MMLLIWLACAPQTPVAPSPVAPAPVGIAQILAAPTPGADFPAPPTPAHTPELAAGEGRDAVTANCSVCHSTTYITAQPPLPPEKWKAEVDKMVNAYGAQLADADRASIIGYLTAHYGPDRR